MGTGFKPLIDFKNRHFVYFISWQMKNNNQMFECEINNTIPCCNLFVNATLKTDIFSDGKTFFNYSFS